MGNILSYIRDVLFCRYCYHLTEESHLTKEIPLIQYTSSIDTQSHKNKQFYKSLKALSNKMHKKIVIGSIGEINIGKSSLLNQIFDLQFKVKDLFYKNDENQYFEEIEKGENLFVDFEGFDKSGTDTMTENCLFSSSFAFCNIILLHIPIR